jgi:LPS O-antigen subunit length determinant protein (WzzB/FepE family)
MDSYWKIKVIIFQIDTSQLKVYFKKKLNNLRLKKHKKNNWIQHNKTF